MRTLARPITIALLALTLLTACSPIRPVSKVGLLAPFEGLYREDGYAALHGLRVALAECAPGLDIVPLALDDAADPAQARRAAQKLRVDPAVDLVMGPFALDAILATRAVLDDIAWRTPLHLAPTGFAPSPTTAWPTLLVDTIRATMPAATLTVIGLPGELTPEALRADPTILFVPDAAAAPSTITTEAVLWFGDPAQAAAWLNSGALEAEIPLFLGTAYGAEIIAAHAAREQTVYWMIWRDVEYNRWSETFAPTQSSAQSYPAYLTYRALCPVLQQRAGIASTEPPAGQVDVIPLAAGLSATDAAPR